MGFGSALQRAQSLASPQILSLREDDQANRQAMPRKDADYSCKEVSHRCLGLGVRPERPQESTKKNIASIPLQKGGTVRGLLTWQKSLKRFCTGRLADWRANVGTNGSIPIGHGEFFGVEVGNNENSWQ